MKKMILLLTVCFYASLVFGQLEVDSQGCASLQKSLFVSGDATIHGQTTIDLGLTVKGITGAVNRGVFCVSSSMVHPGWDPILGNPLSLISTQSKYGESPFTNYYQGVSNFRVGYDGSVFTKFGLIQSSDSLCKENIAPLPSTLSKLLTLNGVSFDYKENDDDLKNDSLSNEPSTLSVNAPMSDIQRQIQVEKDRKRIGLIAQDVEKVYPEVVRTQNDGTKGILYSDLVAVLVEGIKELNSQVTTLQDQVATLQDKLDQIQSGKEFHAPLQDKSKTSSKMFQEAVLYQNTPNPSNHETEIAYRIPNDVSAFIDIYNLSGLKLKSYALTETSGSITVDASELAPGIYIYSMIINNQEVDSKRMIIKK